MLNDYPLVSVAIITYNQKKFLEECIRSILSQDYPNIEIIIADDGSTDGTKEILEKYAKDYPGIFILKVSDRNRGITENSNAAHFACTGKYIAWMGGDDLMLPGKLRKQVDYMERNPECSVCYHDLDVFESSSNETLYRFSDKNKPREGDIKTVIKYGCFNGGCATMVRTKDAPRDGFNSMIPVASDWGYWVDALAGGGEIRYLPEVLGRYRRHGDNVTKKVSVIGQNSIDHLNTCNYLLSKYPEYFNEIMFCYSVNIRSLRENLPYFKSLFFSFRVSFDIKSLAALFVFFVTFGRFRI